MYVCIKREVHESTSSILFIFYFLKLFAPLEYIQNNVEIWSTLAMSRIVDDLCGLVNSVIVNFLHMRTLRYIHSNLQSLIQSRKKLRGCELW